VAKTDQKKDLGVEEIFLYSPARASAGALREYKRRASTGLRLGWGIPEIDDYMIPLMQGDQISIVGRPGQAKTSLCIAFAKRASMLAKAAAGTEDGSIPVVVYCTWETILEEFVGLVQAGISGQSLEAIARGTADLARVEDAVIRGISDRLYVIGRSIEVGRRGARPVALTLPIVDELIGALIDDGKQPVLIVLDYLQRIPAALSRMDDRQRVVYNANYGKEMAMRHACALMQAVQAGRKTDEYSGLKFPQLNDAQWGSDIEQTTDKFISVTRPSTYLPFGSTLQSGSGRIYTVNEELLAIKWQKQRWGRAGAVHFLSFNPALLTIGPMNSAVAEDPDEEEVGSTIPF